MSWLDWLAAVVLCVDMPIPVFWLLVHPFIVFWRRRPRLVYAIVYPFAWLLVTGIVYSFRDRLFASRQAPSWAVVLGLALVLGDIYFLWRVQRELGGRRMIGRVELAGGGELAQHGLYAHVRHPRYTGMVAAVIGACLIAGTLLLWVVAVGWWLLALLAVSLEERELRARFGQAYVDYARRVPRFLPFRFWPSEE